MLEPLNEVIRRMDAQGETDIITFIQKLKHLNDTEAEKVERRITRRIDNLVDTLAYKHEVKAMEDVVHLLKIRVDATDFVQKDNDRRHAELTSAVKKKADFTYYLKNKEWLKKQQEEIKFLDSKIKRFVLYEDLDKTNSFADELFERLQNLNMKVERDYCTTKTVNKNLSDLEAFVKENYITTSVHTTTVDKQKSDHNKLLNKTEKLQASHEKLQKDHRDLLNISARKTDIKNLQEQVDKLCKYEDLKILYNKV